MKTETQQLIKVHTYTTSESEFDADAAGQTKVSWTGNLKYLAVGLMLGLAFVKGEIISWYRIQEMFRFQSFHMYGVIGSAVIVAMISVLLIKRYGPRAANGEPVSFPAKKFSIGQVYGGLMFGLGWAMTGACPGPLFAQIGTGALVVSVVLLSAIAGTWFYGKLADRLPH